MFIGIPTSVLRAITWNSCLAKRTLESGTKSVSKSPICIVSSYSTPSSPVGGRFVVVEVEAEEVAAQHLLLLTPIYHDIVRLVKWLIYKKI